MTSAVKICRAALSHIGSEANISSIDPPDGSVEAGFCESFFDIARLELIEPGSWSFTLKRATLAEVTNESTAWAYAYAMPSDLVRALRVLTTGSIDDRKGVPFTVEGQVLFTNQESAVLIYSCDVTDVSKFTGSFISAFGYLMAGYLAGPIIKGAEGARMGESMRQRAMSMASLAATSDANAGMVDGEFTPSSIAARA